MKHGKREKVSEKRRMAAIRPSALLLTVLLLLVCTGGAAAYLRWSTLAADNGFIPERSELPTINESFNGTTKQNVTVTVGNTDYSVRVRAAIVATWVNNTGEVNSHTPLAGTDYTISYGSGWTQGGDGYWYCNTVIPSGGTTPVLITSCTSNGTEPSGYHLDVEILAQTIQSAGMTDDGLESPMQNVWQAP